MTFRHLRTEQAEREEALKVATAEVGTLQALLGTERELVCLRHSYDRLKGVARDLGFDAAKLLRTYAHDDPILCTSFRRLCQAMFNRLGHV